MIILVAIVTLLVALTILLVAALLRPVRPKPEFAVTPEWIAELSLERYRPMLRLLCGDDLRFLRSQPGFKACMEWKLRQQRCAVFATYIQNLRSDFQQAVLALTLVMMQSRHDRPELAAALLRPQIQFAAGLLLVRVQMLLYRYGLGTVEVGGLLRVFDLMRVELRAVAPATMSVPA